MCGQPATLASGGLLSPTSDETRKVFKYWDQAKHHALAIRIDPRFRSTDVIDTLLFSSYAVFLATSDPTTVRS